MIWGFRRYNLLVLMTEEMEGRENYVSILSKQLLVILLTTTSALDEKWICDESNEFCFVLAVYGSLRVSLDL